MKVNEISGSINKVGTLDPSQTRPKEVDNINGQGQAAEKEFEKGTKVDISQRSVEFSKAAEKMVIVTEERAAKIEQLKEMVKTDTYNVDSKKVAEKVLADSITDLI
ncbi:MAG: flagellar biosynthesis anti-sigma factor FlgM [Deltaproteobacteria bacterium]|nr:flagellar biosynthesis anti-sigma factor FlgM [Deltaproteobacteria bacterium]